MLAAIAAAKDDFLTSIQYTSYFSQLREYE